MEANVNQSDGKTILIVDDHKLVVRDLAHMLSRDGYRALTATNGADAVRILEDDRADLVLLNVELSPDAGNVSGPFCDGFVILDWVHKMHHAEKTPVIIISASDPEKYRDRARAAGIATILAKPMDREKLLEAIHNILGASSPSHPRIVAAN
jgi:chemosensory pili system protein ChpA (sensor histidine kinase/response regulator)